MQLLFSTAYGTSAIERALTISEDVSPVEMDEPWSLFPVYASEANSDVEMPSEAPLTTCPTTHTLSAT